MRRTGMSLVTGLAVLAGSLGLAVVSADTAQADSTTPLPWKNLRKIVVDDAHQHLFLSQGTDTSSSILVTDFSGNVVTTITNQGGVRGLTLSRDDKTLYAALGSDHAVSAIDTATLTETARYPLASGETPVDVAFESGKVWVSYSDSSGGEIGYVDPAAATPAVTPADGMSWGFVGTPSLAADPSDSGALVAAMGGAAASYDVSTLPVTVRVKPASYNTTCENQKDVAVAPGGAEFVLACGAPYAHYRYRTSDLSQAGAYASDSYPNAVAIAANGDVAAGISGWYSKDVYVYAPHGDTPLNTYEFGGPALNLADDGLAFTADASKLFAVLQDLNTGALSLRVLDQPTLTSSTLTLGGTTSAVLGKSVTLTGTLALNVGSVPAGTHVTVVRTLPGNMLKPTFTPTIAANGTFQLTDTPKTLGTYTYTVSYAGDSTRAAATAVRKVTITRLPTSLSVTTNAGNYAYGATATVTAHLGTTYSGRTISIYAQQYGTSTARLLRTGHVDSHGNLIATFAMTHNTLFSAVFTGDAKYAPARAIHTSYAEGGVSSAIGGWFTTARYGSTSYRVYHHTAKLVMSVGVTPNKHGQCVEFFVQEYYQGRWYNVLNTGCATLSTASRVTGTFGLTGATGGHYRILAEYLHSSSDNTNSNGYGRWLYFSVVS